MAHPIPLRFPLIQSESPISPIITQAKLITIPNIPNINGKTVLTRQPRSFLRIVCEKSTGKILGAQMMCARATDMIGEFSAAIVAGITAGEIAPAIRPHPTFNEAVGEALRTWTEE